MSQLAKYEFVSRFYNEFTNATPSGREDVIKRFCEEARSSHDNSIMDMGALRNAARSYHLQPRSWAILDTLLKDYDDEKKKPRYWQEQECLARKMIALWGLERVCHYNWHCAAKDFLVNLDKIATAVPVWEDFAKLANAVMIVRHENSLRVTTTKKLGCQASGSRLQGSLNPSDLKDILKQGIYSEVGLREERVQAWLEPCQCLTANGTSVSSEQYAHFALQKDAYGLLELAVQPAERTTSCSKCYFEPPKRKDHGGLRLPSPKKARNGAEHEDSDLQCPTPSSNGRDRSESPLSDVPDSEILSTVGSPQSPISSALSATGSPQGSLFCHSQQSAAECQICGGKCSACVVPDGTDSAYARQLQVAAHKAVEMDLDPRAADVTQNIHFASIGLDSQSNSDYDVLSLSLACFEDLAQNRQHLFQRPILIQEDFQDSHEHTIESCLRELECTYAGIKIPQQRTGHVEVDLIDSTEVIATLHEHSPLVPARIQLTEVIGSTKPKLTRMHRFSLMKRLMNRIKARALQEGRQPVSCEYENFNVFSSKGAYSPFQRQFCGGFWLRCLAGEKVWWFVPNSSMSLSDWEEFNEEGSNWKATGKARALFLQPGDMLFVPTGWTTIHAELTIEAACMNGGLFWDEVDVVSHGGGRSTEMAPLCQGELSKLQLELIKLVDAQLNLWPADQVAELRRRISETGFM